MTDARGVWLFPGQGSQRPGMLHALADEPAADAVLAAASDALGEDALDLDTPESLAGTRGTQLALLLAGVISARGMLAEGVEPAYVAGHSLGNWTAATVAGSLELPDAVRLIDIRGTRMAEANPEGYGMAAVIGLSAVAVDAIAATVRDEGLDVWASNRNTPDQTAVSGSHEALERVVALAREAGASRATILRVAVAAHSPIMEPVGHELLDRLQQIDVRRPRWPIAGNVNGRTLRRPDQVRTDLADGTRRPVAWDEATSTLRERGVDYWLQALPGASLIGMVQRQWPQDRAWCLASVSTAESANRIRRISPA